MSGFFQSVSGKPVREWPGIAETFGIQFQIPQSLTTVISQLSKAALLTYLWVEPNLLPNRSSPWETLLYDEFIVDNTGRPGTQPFIYFPPRELQSVPVDQSIKRLYELTLLCKVDIIDQSGVWNRFFTPLNVPGLLIAKFDPGKPGGGPTYALWSKIRQRMQQRVQKFVTRSAIA
jgi:hypothetical protein